MTSSPAAAATEAKTETDYLTEVQNAMIQLKKNTARRREEHSEWMKAFWANPKTRRKMHAIQTSQEHKQKISQGVNAAYTNHPELRDKMSEIMKAVWKRKRDRC